jgi:hypothetical protein
LILAAAMQPQYKRLIDDALAFAREKSTFASAVRVWFKIGIAVNSWIGPWTSLYLLRHVLCDFSW